MPQQTGPPEIAGDICTCDELRRWEAALSQATARAHARFLDFVAVLASQFGGYDPQLQAVMLSSARRRSAASLTRGGAFATASKACAQRSTFFDSKNTAEGLCLALNRLCGARPRHKCSSPSGRRTTGRSSTATEASSDVYPASRWHFKVGLQVAYLNQPEPTFSL